MSEAFTKQTLDYNAKDTCNTMEILTDLHEELLERGYGSIYDFTLRAFPPLQYMMLRGIKCDQDQLAKTRKEAGDRIDELQLELNQIVGHELSVNSPAQVKEYFYVEKGIKPYLKTTTKSDGSKHNVPTCDDKALQRLASGTQARRGLREASLIQEIRGLAKLKSTYLEIDFDRDSRLRCDIKPRGTRYGRFSTSKTIFGTGMNMQNLPPQFKKFLVADDGCIMWEQDKAQAEWVVVAYLALDPNMIRIHRTHADPHGSTAELMFKIPLEVILHENKLLGHESDPVKILATRQDDDVLSHFIDRLPRTMTARQAGKKSNHGLNYDEGPQTFALTNEITEKEAKEIINKYDQAYPNRRQYWYERVKEQLQANRTLTNCFGRSYRFLQPWGNDLFKAAYAFEPQSTVADLLTEGICSIYEDTSKETKHNELLMTVHDSLLGQYNLEDGNYRDFALSMMRCKRFLNPTLRINDMEFEIGTDLKIGTNWGHMIEVPIHDNLAKMEQELRSAVSGLKATK